MSVVSMSAHCLKITQNVAFQVFKNSKKWTIFGIFNQLLSTKNVNVARFARNVECDFLGDFQTLWSLTAFLRLIMRPLFLISSSQGSEKIEVFVWYYSMLYLCSLFFFPQFLDLFFPGSTWFFAFFHHLQCAMPRPSKVYLQTVGIWQWPSWDHFSH